MAVDSQWMAIHALSGIPSSIHKVQIARLLTILLQWQVEWGEVDAAEELRSGMDSLHIEKQAGECDHLIMCEESGCTAPITYDDV